MAFGVTPQGFNAKTEADILSSAQGVQLAQIDPNLDLQITNPLGVINGIFAAELAEGWQALAVIYDGMDADEAGDEQLTSLALLTGTQREGEIRTQVPGCTVNVNAGFSAAKNTMFAAIIGQPAAVFWNKAPVSNPGGVAADVTVDFEAVNAGPQQCLAGTLTVISQPLTGWNSITNAQDGIPGQFVEADPALRTKRAAELAAAGDTTADAVRSAILEASQNGKFTAPVITCKVLFNDSDYVDGNGLPPHSIEALVYQPGAQPEDDQLLVDLIATTKAGGINTWGGLTGAHTDTQGFNETIRFSRPTPRRIYIAITVKKLTSDYPVDGDLEVAEQLASYGAGIGVGNIVYAKHVQSNAFKVAGVLDIPAFTIDTVFPPVATGNITIGVREVSTFSTGDIAVTSVT